jgi:hypothetical protein
MTDHGHPITVARDIVAAASVRITGRHGGQP